LVAANMVLVMLNIHPRWMATGYFLPLIFTAINMEESPIVGLSKAMTLMFSKIEFKDRIEQTS
jgi:hypothetical protein